LVRAPKVCAPMYTASAPALMAAIPWYRFLAGERISIFLLMLALLIGHFGIAGAKLGKIRVWWGDFFGGLGVVWVFNLMWMGKLYIFCKKVWLFFGMYKGWVVYLLSDYRNKVKYRGFRLGD